MTPTNIREELEPLCHKVKICGSYRRGKPDFNDLDIVCIPKNPMAISQWVSSRASEITKAGGTWKQFFIGDQKVDLILTDHYGWAGSVLQWTGPGKFNIVCRRKAKDKGWKLNNRGLWDNKTGRCVAYKSELEILALIGMAHHLKPSSRRKYE